MFTKGCSSVDVRVKRDFNHGYLWLAVAQATAILVEATTLEHYMRHVLNFIHATED